MLEWNLLIILIAGGISTAKPVWNAKVQSEKEDGRRKSLGFCRNSLIFVRKTNCWIFVSDSIPPVPRIVTLARFRKKKKLLDCNNPFVIDITFDYVNLDSNCSGLLGLVKVNIKVDQIIQQVTKSTPGRNSNLVIPKRHMVRLFARVSDYFNDYQRAMLNLLVSNVGNGVDVILKLDMPVQVQYFCMT
jgi:hypothetical protein